VPGLGQVNLDYVLHRGAAAGAAHGSLLSHTTRVRRHAAAHVATTAHVASRTMRVSAQPRQAHRCPQRYIMVSAGCSMHTTHSPSLAAALYKYAVSFSQTAGNITLLSDFTPNLPGVSSGIHSKLLPHGCCHLLPDAPTKVLLQLQAGTHHSLQLGHLLCHSCHGSRLRHAPDGSCIRWRGCRCPSGRWWQWRSSAPSRRAARSPLNQPVRKLRC